ncbi:succinate dehydrogenase cytochrome b558 subunit [Paenibacillus urinalis]|uniref:Succinate dehydrogenase cytochrome b558 subunit n=1 Tax=Paenibacillus urinalis TaxID=521520 RepID=A0AAX3MYP6_9BACL|nr:MULTISPECIES: succinate dehydrogenase cytochrome b558 subunit [Paenibacillus]WDH81919.1 succinate dehydrogenase cytochrome b558 subunit [Paenibacillus urinalis]WDH97967.1 succinate dehydrogenase cytochrome b558 subunit [Paenibacillus urinalis]WDI01648.1 succinate dehydrogenase cytochrome b558 subunit [Paenibacillus urinalis]GAK42554.1 succinate dehydrogenase cytochrome b558 subunit [Paenibacillus sp. TCA20]
MKGYYARKIHSLLGLIPLSVFFLMHMFSNFAAVEGGPERFQSAVNLINSLPLLLLMEIFVIYVPMLYHGVYGLYIAYQAQPNVGRFNNERNWRYTFQRISGVITFVFVIWHVYQTRVQVFLGEVSHEELGALMHSIVTNPVYFIIYLISVVAASYHFANGLWAFLVSWGITRGPRAQRVSSYVCMSLFAVCSIMFVASIFAFRSVEFDASAVIEMLKVTV